MKKTRFSETKIVSILKRQEAGISTADICREFGISQATFYNWKAKYGGLEVREVKRLKELEVDTSLPALRVIRVLKRFLTHQ